MQSVLLLPLLERSAFSRVAVLLLAVVLVKRARVPLGVFEVPVLFETGAPDRGVAHTSRRVKERPFPNGRVVEAGVVSSAL
jgi:hypothetical protein